MRYFIFYSIFFWFGCTHLLSQTPANKVLYLNSYHAGYSSSDSVMAAIKEAFGKNKNILLQTFFFNAKKENDAPSINKNVQLFLKQYDAFQPDLLIVSDDDAMREIVVPFILKDSIPVVFCGINWSTEEYHLPKTTTAGMLEVLPIKSLFREMKKRYPAAKRITVLSESSPVEKKNTLYLNPIFKKLNLAATYELVNDFATWKIKFEEANKLSDIIYLPTNGTIKGWDVEEAKNFIKATIKKPVVTCDDFMMPYAVYGETKIAKEQGEWAAATALAILSGKAAERIGVAQNRLSKRWLNQELAKRIGF